MCFSQIDDSIYRIVTIQSRVFTMNSNNLLSISEFSKLCGLPRQTLIYYDRIGLFSPICVKENKYRMYAHSQIERISSITILSDLGVPLKRIKEIMTDVSPQKMTEILHYQLNVITEKTEKLNALKDMLYVRIDQIVDGESRKSQIPYFCVTEISEKTPFFVGRQIDCLHADVTDEIILDFFKTVEKENLPVIFALGYLKDWKDVKNGNYALIRRIGFRLKNEARANRFMPAGKYAVGYFKGEYGENAAAYKSFRNYIAENRLNAFGTVYEEYLIDELAEKSPDNFVFKLSVRVK